MYIYFLVKEHHNYGHNRLKLVLFSPFARNRSLRQSNIATFCYFYIGSPLWFLCSLRKSIALTHEYPRHSGGITTFRACPEVPSLRISTALFRLFYFVVILFKIFTKKCPKKAQNWPILGYFTIIWPFLSIFRIKFYLQKCAIISKQPKSMKSSVL